MYYNLIGSTFTFNEYKGKLLEDVIGLYLFRIFSKNSQSSITYDSAKNGADFILDPGVIEAGKIIMEVGMGNKGFGQVLNSSKKITAKYGLSISSTLLALDSSQFCVTVPIKFFLLV